LLCKIDRWAYVGKRKLDDLSVEELEKALRLKQRQSRLERFQRLSHGGHTVDVALTAVEVMPPVVSASRRPPHRPASDAPPAPPKSRRKKAFDFALLGLEVVAVLGLVGVLIASYYNLRELNSEVSLAQQTVVQMQAAPTPTAAPAIALNRLPGGHTSPTAPGGAVPDVPPHLERWIQPAALAAHQAASTIAVKPPEAAAPTRIVIPKINVNAPIVDGVNWNDLKKGVGHLPGSANPGERGNLYLAAHNDIYGEIFRDLELLEVGDEYTIYAGDEGFRYVVKEKRIIEPSEVEVMLPTTEPVATLQTCYPYLVDTHRLVVIGELAE
jgi:sortase A